MAITLIYCGICQKEILANADYVRLTDYHQGKFVMEGYYHTGCYSTQISLTNPQQIENAKQALRMAKDMIKNEDLITYSLAEESD